MKLRSTNDVRSFGHNRSSQYQNIKTIVLAELSTCCAVLIRQIIFMFVFVFMFSLRYCFGDKNRFQSNETMKQRLQFDHSTNQETTTTQPAYQTETETESHHDVRLSMSESFNFIQIFHCCCISFVIM